LLCDNARAGTFEGTGDRLLCGVKEIGDICGTVTEHVTQNQHGPLTWR